MGVMTTIQIMRQLAEEWTLSDKMTVSWDIENKQQVAYAEKMFRKYLDDGWIAFSEEPTGRRQIFKFNPQLKKIVLLPPLGGG